MTVRIIEMSLRMVGGGAFPGLIPTPFNVVQSAIAPTSTPQDSSVFGTITNIVRIEADEDVHVDIAASPTATTDHPLIYGGSARDFLVIPGHKVSVRTP